MAVLLRIFTLVSPAVVFSLSKGMINIRAKIEIV